MPALRWSVRLKVVVATAAVLTVSFVVLTVAVSARAAAMARDDADAYASRLAAGST